MSVEKRKIGDRGQVTIPKRFRDEENIRGGDKVDIKREEGRIIIEKTGKRELEEAYKEMAERDEAVAEEWKHTSREADELIPHGDSEG